MSKQLTAETIVCSEYQRLLEACVSAREILNEQRAEIFRSPPALEAMVEEVLRSQVRASLPTIAEPREQLPPVHEGRGGLSTNDGTSALIFLVA